MCVNTGVYGICMNIRLLSIHTTYIHYASENADRETNKHRIVVQTFGICYLEFLFLLEKFNKYLYEIEL